MKENMPLFTLTKKDEVPVGVSARCVYYTVLSVVRECLKALLF